MTSESVTIATSWSTQTLGTRRAIAALLLIGICPALFAGVPRLAADGPGGLDPLGFEETVPTSLVAIAVLPSPEASVSDPDRPHWPPPRRSEFPSPLSLRAPPGA